MAIVKAILFTEWNALDIRIVWLSSNTVNKLTERLTMQMQVSAPC